MDALAVLLVEGIDWIQDVGIGPPEFLEASTSAWITAGDIDTVVNRVTEVVDANVILIVWFGFLVEGREEDAERKVLRGMMGLTRLLKANRAYAVGSIGPKLDGNVVSLGLPVVTAGGQGYSIYAGQEARLFPLGIPVTVRE